MQHEQIHISLLHSSISTFHTLRPRPFLQHPSSIHVQCSCAYVLIHVLIHVLTHVLTDVLTHVLIDVLG